jgi:hypothetical protein
MAQRGAELSATFRGIAQELPKVALPFCFPMEQ